MDMENQISFWIRSNLNSNFKLQIAYIYQYQIELLETQILKLSMSFDPQTRLNSSSKKPEKLVLLEPKLEMLDKKSSMMHVLTRQFETQGNSNSIKSELDLAQIFIQLMLRLDNMFAGSAIFGDAQKESHTRNQSATFCLQWKNKKNFLDCSYVLCNTKVKYDRCII